MKSEVFRWIGPGYYGACDEGHAIVYYWVGDENEEPAELSRKARMKGVGTYCWYGVNPDEQQARNLACAKLGLSETATDEEFEKALASRNLAYRVNPATGNPVFALTVRFDTYYVNDLWPLYDYLEDGIQLHLDAVFGEVQEDVSTISNSEKIRLLLLWEKFLQHLRSGHGSLNAEHNAQEIKRGAYLARRGFYTTTGYRYDPRVEKPTPVGEKVVAVIRVPAGYQDGQPMEQCVVLRKMKYEMRPEKMK